MESLPRINSPGKGAHIRIEPSVGWAALELAELWRSRELVYVLFARDLILRYRQTAVGIVWVILQPLTASLIFAAVFGRFARLPSDGVPYLPFVFAGMLPWTFFSGALQRSSGSLIADARLISKVYFPRMVIPIASCASVLVDFAVALSLMFVLMWAAGIAFTFKLALLAGLVLLTSVLALGLGLFFSALSVYYRDFSHVLPFLIQIWMFASPVVYSSRLVPETYWGIYVSNPMVGVIEAFRWCFFGVGGFPAGPLAISVAFAVGALASGAWFFQRVQRNFADSI